MENIVNTTELMTHLIDLLHLIIDLLADLSKHCALLIFLAGYLDFGVQKLSQISCIF